MPSRVLRGTAAPAGPAAAARSRAACSSAIWNQLQSEVVQSVGVWALEMVATVVAVWAKTMAVGLRQLVVGSVVGQNVAVWAKNMVVLAVGMLRGVSGAAGCHELPALHSCSSELCTQLQRQG